jgi:uncharacterized delta-60 repeat protein
MPFRRVSLLAAAILSVLAAGPAGAHTGRVAFSVGLPSPAGNVDVSGATAAVARPDGGAVLFGDEPGRGIVAAAIDADGALDRRFGSRGVSHVRVGGGARFMTLSAHARPDGRLLVVGTLPTADPLQLPELVVVALTAAGGLDASFGAAGVARPGIQGSCGNCDPAALSPDGSLVLTGNTGAGSPEIAHDPDAPNTFTWAVTRLAPDGRPARSFGARQVSGPARGAGGGYGAAVAADGRITLVGRDASGSAAARLRGDGSADPSFGGDGVASVPSSVALSFALGDDGSITALGTRSISRLRPDGTLDAGFGDGGSVPLDGSFARLLGIGDGQVLVFRPHVQAQPANAPALVVDRFDAAGRRTTAKLHLSFGGGVASFYGARGAMPALDQNAFRGVALVRRSGGGYLAAGGVTIQQYAGEGEGWSTARFAAAALTDELDLDRTYGPRTARVRSSVRLVRQRARASRRLRSIAVRISASRPGLARIQVRDRRGRTLARGVEPLYEAGSRRVRVPLTTRGLRALRRRGVHVRVDARFRDVLAAEDAAPRVRGPLR